MPASRRRRIAAGRLLRPTCAASAVSNAANAGNAVQWGRNNAGLCSHPKLAIQSSPSTSNWQGSAATSKASQADASRPSAEHSKPNAAVGSTRPSAMGSQSRLKANQCPMLPKSSRLRGRRAICRIREISRIYHSVRHTRREKLYTKGEDISVALAKGLWQRSQGRARPIAVTQSAESCRPVSNTVKGATILMPRRATHSTSSVVWGLPQSVNTASTASMAVARSREAGALPSQR